MDSKLGYTKRQYIFFAHNESDINLWRRSTSVTFKIEYYKSVCVIIREFKFTACVLNQKSHNMIAKHYCNNIFIMIKTCKIFIAEVNNCMFLFITILIQSSYFCSSFYYIHFDINFLFYSLVFILNSIDIRFLETSML